MLVQASAYFDAEWYTDRFPDVARTGLDPAEHYLWVGALMGRDPSPWFSGAYYLEQNPEVAAIAMNPLVHFLRHGLMERRSARSDDAGPPLPHQRPKYPLVGPPPWGDAQRRSRLRAALESDGVSTAPGTAALELADAILAAGPPLAVSVILPVIGARFFDALESVLAQSLSPAEVLLIHPPGSDATLRQLRRNYSDHLSSGALRLLQAPGDDRAPAIAVGHEAARGDLIAYLDGESLWRPDYLRIMAAWFTECDDLMTGHAAWVAHRPRLGQGQTRGHGPVARQILLDDPAALDLSAYAHRREVWDWDKPPDATLGAGGVWEMILRQTARFAPGHLPMIAADTFREGAGRLPQDVKDIVAARHRRARFRHGVETPRLAYVLWDWPALSQSFVRAELAWLVARGFDVEVFYKIAPDRAAQVPFDIAQHQVDTPEELARRLLDRDRTLVHCHFAYPAMTLLCWPACRIAEIPFTFCAHAVDIFLHNNIAVNRIDEVMRDPLCLRAFVPGDHHRRHLQDQDIPVEKLAYTLQAVDLDLARAIPDRPPPSPDAPVRGVFIARFVDKKGIEVLIEAAALLQDTRVHFDIHGYGPLEAEVKARAAILGVRNVTFHGPLDGPYAVRDALEAADFFIAPSIVAPHGDTEGFPTIVLEAMAARRPVVTTSVSSLGEYLMDGVHAHVATPGDARHLADRVRALLGMPAPARTAMLRNACTFLSDHVGVDRTMQAYCDQWFDAQLEIVLVTLNDPGSDTREDTLEIIRRIRAHTTTPYRLTVVDNGSDERFRDALRKLAGESPGIRLHLLNAGRNVGEAINLALAGSDAVFAISISAKHGFVAKHGWERPLLARMRSEREAAMGGSLCHLPSHTLGGELTRLPGFARFRSPAFAQAHPARPFRHVQGGCVILRRDVVGPDRGFSETLPESDCDVEFSYVMASHGHRLTAIPEVSALAGQTQPGLEAVIDETTAVAHPLGLMNVPQLDRLQVPGVTRCNLCQGWNCIDRAGRCRQCESSGMDRKLWQMLAHDWRTRRGGKALLLDAVGSLAAALGNGLFEVTATTWADQKQDAGFALICLGSLPDGSRLTQLLGRLAPGGLMVWPETPGAEPAALVGGRPDLRGGHWQRLSRVLRSDSRRLSWIACDPVAR